jgi:hypothetical protein
MRKKPKTVMIIVLVIMLLVYPFKVTVVPEWSVKVVDENGKPLPGAYVEEFARQWTLDYDHHAAVCTNLNGEAQFPRETLRVGVAVHAAKWISLLGPHASLGPVDIVAVERLGYGPMSDENTKATWNGFANRVNTQFVLHKCPNGFTGYQCYFDYPYFFGINSSSRQIAACQSGLGSAVHMPD